MIARAMSLKLTRSSVEMLHTFTNLYKRIRQSVRLNLQPLKFQSLLGSTDLSLERVKMQLMSKFRRFRQPILRVTSVFLSIAGLIGCFSSSGSGGTITTVAGTAGNAGYAGDDAPATSAKLDNPRKIALDSSGNLYIADTVNNVIRKVTASTGIITTIAGNGTPGNSGDNGLATKAALNSPNGVAVDSSGNIYIADTGNNVIREVSASSGVIERVAGNGTSGYSGDEGYATNATLNSPNGVALDPSGDIYIADTNNDVIRKVTASSDIITTVAGSGSAGYSGDKGAATSAKLTIPDSVAVDSSGNIYIADTGNNVIREVAASSGDITTIAGNGTSGYSGDNGAATSAKLSIPNGVAVDSSGNTYVADTGNNVIREIVASSGEIKTVAGTGTSGYSGDNGKSTSAKLNSPYGVALDSSGDIYIADTGNDIIRKDTIK
jgi:sugar lactone lactonase YvrE